MIFIIIEMKYMINNVNIIIFEILFYHNLMYNSKKGSLYFIWRVYDVDYY